MICFACPSCHREIKASEVVAGRMTVCPSCHTGIAAPDPADYYDVAVSCPKCERLITLPENEKRRLTECARCFHRFRPSDCHCLRVTPQGREQEPDEEPIYYTPPSRSRLPYLWRVLGLVGGVVVSPPIGFLSAHHFALFGGFNLLGNPYSPARYSLVPGHIVVWGLRLGLAGFLVGWCLDRIGKR